MLVMIDNYDSFTYNLARYFKLLGQNVLVTRNDAITLETIETLSPDAIVLSPGPGKPEAAGICLNILKSFIPLMPLYYSIVADATVMILS